MGVAKGPVLCFPSFLELAFTFHLHFSHIYRSFWLISTADTMHTREIVTLFVIKVRIMSGTHPFLVIVYWNVRSLFFFLGACLIADLIKMFYFVAGMGLGILGLYCYRCVSTHPGCSTPFNWLWYWGEQCPEYDDKCVKIIERKGGESWKIFPEVIPLYARV